MTIKGTGRKDIKLAGRRVNCMNKPLKLPLRMLEQGIDRDGCTAQPDARGSVRS